MINKETMEILNQLGFGADIDALESYVKQLRDSYGEGNPLVDDSQYDLYHKLLEELKPDSEVLMGNWEVEDNPLDANDEVLKEYGMSSIRTIDEIDYDSLADIGQIIYDSGKSVELFGSIKENGHAARAVYVNGKLVGGSTRGRYKKGRDISRHLMRLLPNEIPQLSVIPIVEIRGEMIVKKETFDNVLRFWELKTPLSSVTSLIRESATDEEIDMLDFVGYRVIPSDRRYLPSTLEMEFKILEQVGIKTPEYFKVGPVTYDNLVSAAETVLGHFEELMDNDEVPYDCDGVVLAINDNELFYGGGKSGNHWLGNVAIKSGRYWESNIYSSEIEEVVFERGKVYLTPKAKIKPVTCNNGAVVTTVPLYNIGVMERYGYVTGSTVYFRFGGEKGVTLCDVYGNSVRV